MRTIEDRSFLVRVTIIETFNGRDLAVDVAADPDGDSLKVELCVHADGGTRPVPMTPGHARRIAHALLVAADVIEAARS